MPPTPLWHRRLRDIRETLAQWPTPILDRAAIEKIFGLRRRSAITLLAQLDGFKAGKTYLVERATLLERLDELAGPKVERAQARRRNDISDYLAEMKRQARPRLIRVTPPMPVPGSNQLLPSGVTTESTESTGVGRMVFCYHSASELLGQLYALATAAASHYAAFEHVVAPEMSSARDNDTGREEVQPVGPGGALGPGGAMYGSGSQV